MQRGYTLIEVMIAMVLLVIISGGVTIFGKYYSESYSFAFQENVAISQAQRVISTISKELRQATTSDSGDYMFQETNDFSLAFFANIDQDELIERVRYYLEDTTLKKSVIKPAGSPLNYSQPEKISIIAEHISNHSTPLFSYYNQDWPTDTTNNPLPQSARLLETTLVGVDVRVDTDLDMPPAEYRVTTTIQVRNAVGN